MAALTEKNPRQCYRNYLLVFLVLSAAKAQLASGGNKHDSSAFYNGMEELQSETDTSKQTESPHSSTELHRTSPHSSAELDRMSASGDAELKRTEDSVQTESDSDRQETSLLTEVYRTDSSSVVESEKQDRSERESDRTEGSLSIESDSEAVAEATESDRTLLSQHVDSDLTSETAGSEASTGQGSDGKPLSSSQLGSDGTTASSSEGESDNASGSLNQEAEGTEASGSGSGDVDLGNSTTLVAPGNTTGGNSTGEQVDGEDGNSAGSKHGPKKVSCAARELSDGETPAVTIVNGSELIHILKVTQNAAGNVTAEGDCVLIMFYAPWCPFSAAAAPAYHALPRAFPSIRVLAIDAIANSHLNTRFGTVAVPNIMLFYNGKALSRFNQSERSLDQFRMFVKNHTGLDGDPSVEIRPEDFAGPLPTAPDHEPDYFLWASWGFVASFAVVAMVRSSLGKRLLVRLGILVPVQHQHAD